MIPEKDMTGREILALMFPQFIRESIEKVLHYDKSGMPKKVFLELEKEVYFNSKCQNDVIKFINRILKLSYWI